MDKPEGSNSTEENKKAASEQVEVQVNGQSDTEDSEKENNFISVNIDDKQDSGWSMGGIGAEFENSKKLPKEINLAHVVRNVIKNEQNSSTWGQSEKRSRKEAKWIRKLSNEIGACESLKVKDIYRALIYMQKKHETNQLLRYLVFFGIYVYIVVSLFNIVEVYGQTAAIEDIFVDEEFPNEGDGPFFKKNFLDIGTFEEYWEWVNGPLLRTVYNNEYFNGQPYNATSKFVVPSGFGGNQIVGSLRFRTARVAPNTKRLCSEFNEEEIPTGETWPDCYPPYRQSTKYTGPWRDFNFEEDMSKVRGLPGYGGEGNQGYGTDGYTFYLPLYHPNGTALLYEEAQQIIQENLIDNFWTDAQTRILVVDFNIIGLNLGNGMACRFVVEIMAGGGFFWYWRLYPLLLNPLGKVNDVVRFILEILFLIAVIGYLGTYVASGYRQRRGLSYIFSSLWNVVDVLNLLLSFIVICLLFWAEFGVFNEQFVIELTGFGEGSANQFHDSFEQARVLSYISYLACANLVFGLLKVFKFLRFQSYFTLVWDSLIASIPELAALFSAFLIFITAFALVGHMLFGMWVREFHSVTTSYSTLFRLLVGEFDYAALLFVEPNWAPIYYCLVTFFQVFVLLNMFIAIVGEYYETSKEKSRRDKNSIRNTETLLVRSPPSVYYARMKYWIHKRYYHFSICDGCCRWSGEDNSENNKSPNSNGAVQHANSYSYARKASLGGSMKSRKNSGITFLSLMSYFQQFPSNWHMETISPEALAYEREKWMTVVRRMNRRKQMNKDISNIAFPLKVSPYRKLWWWSIHKVALKLKHERIQRRNHIGTIESSRQDMFKLDVEKSRYVIQYLYGTETLFRRNWNVVYAGFTHSKKLLHLTQLKLAKEKDVIRLKLFYLLWDGVDRQQANRVDLFEVFQKTWARMTPQARDEGALDISDLASIFACNPDDKKSTEDLKRIVRYIECLRDPYVKSKKINLTEMEYIRDDLQFVSDQVKHVKNILIEANPSVKLHSPKRGLKSPQKKVFDFEDIIQFENIKLPRKAAEGENKRKSSILAVGASIENAASELKEQVKRMSTKDSAFVPAGPAKTVTFDTSKPYGMAIATVGRRLVVAGFERGEDGEMLQAEASGEVKVTDQLLSVGGATNIHTAKGLIDHINSMNTETVEMCFQSLQAKGESPGEMK